MHKENENANATVYSSSLATTAGTRCLIYENPKCVPEVSPAPPPRMANGGLGLIRRQAAFDRQRGEPQPIARACPPACSTPYRCC